MKEKSNSQENNATGAATATESTSSSSTTTLSTAVASSTTYTSPAAANISSPYDRMNFMAPPIGGIVKCVTCLGNIVQGKVIAYDSPTKMLALRSSVPNKPGFFDNSMVNLAWCSNLEVIEEPTEPPEPILHLNHTKLEKRKRLNIDNKYKEINSIGTDVSSLAQNLYFTIYKTLTEVEWEGKNIVVMNSVIITPPYDVQSCCGRNSENSHALEHVKKIVKKFNEEYNQENQSMTSSQELNSK